MSRKPSDGIGQRLSRYRRIAGLSARELSERCGYGLTRGVIANIESGRKTDISVDQLIALSAALGIPPAALALPLDEPYRFVRLTDGSEGRHAMRAVRAMDWFNGVSTIFRDQRTGVKPTHATGVAETLIRTLRQLLVIERQIRRREKISTEGWTIAQEVLDETADEKAQLLAILERLQVDLTDFKIDDDG